MATETARDDGPKGAATRVRILQHALRAAAIVGLDGLSIGDLAAELDLSKSGLFAHFKSKERLQLAILDAAAEDFTVRVFVPALKKPRGEPRLNAVFENWLKWISSKDSPGGCVFLAGATEWDDREGPVRERLVEWFEKLNLGLRKAVQLAVQEGQFGNGVEPDQFAFELHGIVLKYHLEARLTRHPNASKRAHAAFEKLLVQARAGA